MYESFFGLHERPFAASPRAKDYFPAAAIEAARSSLVRCVERAEGVGLVVGPSGTGKTLLCHVLADEFKQRLEIALLSSGRLCTRRALLQAILFELGLPYRGMEEGELRLSLIDHLTPGTTPLDGLLLVIDEAHTLPLRLLEEVRLITNLVRNGQPRVRLVLAGGPALEERFANPKLEAFNQRLVARCYLGGFERPETVEFIKAQIVAAGGNVERVFTTDALESVHRATDGIPRLVNQVCDHALVLAYAGGQKQIDKSGIEEAWADLQQLPTPWQQDRTMPSDASVGVIEFGGLDDDPALDEPAAVPFRSLGGSASSEPVAKLAQIEDQLASLDDDFQPIGSIGPEVELSFPELSHPFQEQFAQEEVVIDRYASLEAETMRQRPQVKCREGQEIGRILAQHALPDSQGAPTQATISNETSRKIVAAADPVLPEPWPNMAVAEAPAAGGPNVANVGNLGSKVVPVSQLTTAPGEANAAHAADDDLIIVENAPRRSAPAARPAGKVRRQEYKQLFKQLRRG